ncbi:hypothetical protein [Streptomyces sp. NPDC095817]
MEVLLQRLAPPGTRRPRSSGPAHPTFATSRSDAARASPDTSQHAT